jgi:hypothetical protein
MGEKMHEKDIIPFFTKLPYPLGYGLSENVPKYRPQPKTTIAKEIMGMQIIGYIIYLHSVL